MKKQLLFPALIFVALFLPACGGGGGGGGSGLAPERPGFTALDMGGDATSLGALSANASSTEVAAVIAPLQLQGELTDSSGLDVGDGYAIQAGSLRVTRYGTPFITIESGEIRLFEMDGVKFAAGIQGSAPEAFNVFDPYEGRWEYGTAARNQALLVAQMEHSVFGYWSEFDIIENLEGTAIDPFVGNLGNGAPYTTGFFTGGSGTAAKAAVSATPFTGLAVAMLEYDPNGESNYVVKPLVGTATLWVTAANKAGLELAFRNSGNLGGDITMRASDLLLNSAGDGSIQGRFDSVSGGGLRDVDNPSYPDLNEINGQFYGGTPGNTDASEAVGAFAYGYYPASAYGRSIYGSFGVKK
ncbi:MAG: hypothetical protein LBQ63_04255 [Deltaproteobacteria bacterium]|jgi:hypothetical protein|nr:hypothetical protein [Deltaproteobacteria bacterium]